MITSYSHWIQKVKKLVHYSFNAHLWMDLHLDGLSNAPPAFATTTGSNALAAQQDTSCEGRSQELPHLSFPKQRVSYETPAWTALVLTACAPNKLGGCKQLMFEQRQKAYKRLIVFQSIMNEQS